MKFSRIALLAFLSISIIFSNPFDLISQNTKTKKTKNKPAESIEETVIAKVGKESVKYSEILKAYKKNMSRRTQEFYTLPKDSILDFINLYMNYRLKVIDAVSRGFENDSAVKTEIVQNRKMLAESYYYDKVLIEPNVNAMLDNRDKEFQIAIIVRTFPVDNGKGFDTVATYKQARKILDELLAGADFAKMAKDSSNDPETAMNGGLVVNFITSGRTQRPIDTILTKLKPGEISKNLIRIKDGYIIIKLMRSEPRYFIKASHILLSEGIGKDSMAVIRKADSLISLLKKGYDFARLAEENSDDPASAMRKGSLGSWYSRSTGFDGNATKLLPNFEDAVFNLKDGQISDKVFTEYGIHIVRRDSTRGIDKEAERDELKKLYRRVYFETDKKEFLENVKSKLGFVIYHDALKELVSKLDSSKTTMQPEWNKNVDDNIKKKNLFKIDNTTFTVGEFTDKLSTQRDLKGTSTNTTGLTGAINKLADPIAFDKATENLEKEYPEFDALIKEFRDGILLFKVAAIEVWDKLKFDSVSAYKFWEPKKNNYYTIPIYDLTEVFVLSDTVARDITKFAQEGTDIKSLAEQYTQRKGYREKKGEWGKVSIKDNKLAQTVNEYKPKKGDIVGPITFENGFSVVKVNDFVPAREKTFEEAIPDFAPAYQEQMQQQLEVKWMESLRKKFKVEILTKELDKIINTMKASN